MKIIKEKDLHLPPAPAMAPQIDWGQDFLDWDSEQQNRYLRRLCSALNHAADLIQKERNELLVELNRLKKGIEDANAAVEVRKNTLFKVITDHNAEKQELIKRLQELEVENKSLKVECKKYED